MSVPKIRVTSELLGNDVPHKIETDGLLHNNKIIYYENDVKVTIILEENVVTLLRESNEYQLTFPFEENKKTVGMHKIKTFPMEIEAIIETRLLERDDHQLKLEYHLVLGTEDCGNFTFLLEYEVDV